MIKESTYTYVSCVEIHTETHKKKRDILFFNETKLSQSLLKMFSLRKRMKDKNSLLKQQLSINFSSQRMFLLVYIPTVRISLILRSSSKNAYNKKNYVYKNKQKL